jgi:predicted transcriptional regulator
MLGDLVERVFDGSAPAVMLSLLDCAEVKPGELQELRQILQQKSRKEAP